MANQKYYVTGATGLLGSEILKILDRSDICNKTFNRIDLRHDQPSSNADIWIHCAARVGGIKANSTLPAEFFDDNMLMNISVVKSAKRHNAKLVSVLSTCIYPDNMPELYPMREKSIHCGPPPATNEAYAFSKRMLEYQSRAYRQQHGCNFISVVPNNLYGVNDNYDLDSGHVIPALIRKFHEANVFGYKSVNIWGSGSPIREFTFARDAAKIILWLAKNYDGDEPVNIGNSDQISIAELAHMIAEEIGYDGGGNFDMTKPDGQFEKPSSNKKLRDLGCDIQYTSLREGLKETIKSFQDRYPNVRGVTISK
jgi:GDP-L-fucose synthase